MAILLIAAAFVVAVLAPTLFCVAARIRPRLATTQIEPRTTLAKRLQLLDHDLETIASEVQRVGDGQRALTQAIVDRQRAMGGPTTTPTKRIT